MGDSPGFRITLGPDNLKRAQSFRYLIKISGMSEYFPKNKSEPNGSVNRILTNHIQTPRKRKE